MSKPMYYILTAMAGLLLVSVVLFSSNIADAVEAKKANAQSSKSQEVKEHYYTLSPTLKLDFIYLNNDIRTVRLRNSGKPIIATIFHETYPLGHNDMVEIDPPNLKVFFIDVEPLTKHNLHKPLYSTAQKRTYRVEMPAQKNAVVLKSKVHKLPKKK